MWKRSISMVDRLFLAGCTWRHHCRKSKLKVPPKLLSSSGIRGGKFISVNKVSAQEHVSSQNRHILNFRVMAVRDIKLWTCLSKNFNSRKGQRTNQKYRSLEGSDQQMQRLEETELRKSDHTVGVNCYMFSNISSGTAWILQGMKKSGGACRNI